MINGQLIRCRRRLVAATIVLVPLASVTIGEIAAAQVNPTGAPACSSSPVEISAGVVGVPTEQLRAEVAATVGRTGRPALDVLLERLELATLDRVYRLAAADDRVGVPVTAAGSALLARSAAVRADVLAFAGCLEADLRGAVDTCSPASTPDGG